MFKQVPDQVGKVTGRIVTVISNAVLVHVPVPAVIMATLYTLCTLCDAQHNLHQTC